MLNKHNSLRLATTIAMAGTTGAITRYSHFRCVHYYTNGADSPVASTIRLTIIGLGDAIKKLIIIGFYGPGVLNRGF
jgi:hypothetical protein